MTVAPQRALALAVATSLMSGTGAAGAAPTVFDWPLEPRPIVVTAFDPPPERWLAGHRGVDLDTSTAGSPATARSSADGIVVFAGPVAGRPVVSVDHVGGLRTTYEPVRAVVVAGDRVRRGDPLGVVEAGHPGCPVSVCLHWGMRRGRDYLDPTAAVRTARVRLLPVR